ALVHDRALRRIFFRHEAELCQQCPVVITQAPRPKDGTFENSWILADAGSHPSPVPIQPEIKFYPHTDTLGISAAYPIWWSRNPQIGRSCRVGPCVPCHDEAECDVPVQPELPARPLACARRETPANRSDSGADCRIGAVFRCGLQHDPACLESTR